MPRIFAVHAGAAIQIGAYGVATPETPAIVPDAVAAELADRVDLRIDPEDVEVQTSAAVEAAPSRRRGRREPAEE